MTTKEQEILRESRYTEAMRYIANAKEALKKAGKDGKYFKDRKYVRSASGIAYSGVLVALDAWLELKGIELPKEEKDAKNAKGKKSKTRKSIEFYRTTVAGLDKKLLRDLNIAYEALHLYGYYDGTLAPAVIATGFGAADDIIIRIKPRHLAA